MARSRLRPVRPKLVLPGDGRNEIMRAYDRAKKADPSVTQGRFMMAADPDRWKNEDSASRYFRLLRDEKRTGKKLWSDAARYRPGGLADAYQVRMRDRDGNFHSFNLEMTQARSDYDIAAIQGELKKHPEILDSKRAEWKRRYGEQFELIDDEDEIEVVRVLSTHAPMLHLSIS